MPDVGLATTWIPQLLKALKTIRSERAEELEYLRNELVDPELLAQYYVEPDCQHTNPADHHEDEPERAIRQQIHAWLDGFLKGTFLEKDGRHVAFVLSDAGMGKTSLLVMLQLAYLSRFWPGDVYFKLLKLGPETLGAIGKMEDRSRTVLLLDALDEDPKAQRRLEARLGELLRATEPFRQVMVTCRTQFFPSGGHGPLERLGKIEVGGFVCNRLYLSPFTDTQIETYLRKVYPNTVAVDALKWLRLTDQDNPKLARAREMVKPMKSLRMRPMLLAHIDELMEAGVEKEMDEYSVYERLLERWLLREERKQEGRITKEQLRAACIHVAQYLQMKGKRQISAPELRKLIEAKPDVRHLKALDVSGRSLLNQTSDEKYRFSHYTIQEFLAAYSIQHGIEPPGRLIVTDQLLSFLGFVHIEPGEFLMGSPEDEKGRDGDEQQHLVRLTRRFAIAAKPVTQGQFAKFVEATGYETEAEKEGDSSNWRDSAAEHPVVHVSWNDAQAFCRWLSGWIDGGFRLPTEAEWEYVARAGTTAATYAPKLGDIAWYVKNSGGRSHPVGLKEPNAWGLYDMLGNVYEWCADWSGNYSEGPAVDPEGPHEGAGRVYRGGSWLDLARYVRAASRYWCPPGNRGHFLGFRVSRGQSRGAEAAEPQESDAAEPRETGQGRE